MTNGSQEIEELQFLQNYLQQENDKIEKMKDKLFSRYNKILERLELEKNLDKSRSIREHERKKKKVTTIAIHDKNQKLITKLQKEARNEGFFLSKENIINMGLELLKKETNNKGSSVVDLFQNYNK